MQLKHICISLGKSVHTNSTLIELLPYQVHKKDVVFIELTLITVTLQAENRLGSAHNKKPHGCVGCLSVSDVRNPGINSPHFRLPDVADSNQHLAGCFNKHTQVMGVILGRVQLEFIVSSFCAVY